MAGTKGFSAKDCLAQGKYCVRVVKLSDNSSVEVFLDEEAKVLKLSGLDTEPTIICAYRLTEARDSVEFFLESVNDQIAVQTEHACELALRNFILNPFPDKFTGEDGTIVKA